MIDFRLANAADIPAIAAIYEQITASAAIRAHTGWQPGVYPTAETARAAIAAGEMYVLCDEGKVLAAARLNHKQDDFYAGCRWQATAAAKRPEEVLVIHTLAVDPAAGRSGLGKAFIAFYEEEAKRRGCRCLRLDTNQNNSPARSLYTSLGFREVGLMTSDINGIANVTVVLLEKALTE